MFSSLLNQTCEIQQKTQAQGSTGEVAETWTSALTGIPCRVNESRDPVVVGAIGNVTVKRYTVYLAASVAVDEGNRIKVGGDVYLVINAAKDSSLHHVEARCEKVSFK